jgi:peptidyl-prolyl cis-trans isomerase C
MLAVTEIGTLCPVPVPSRHGYHVLRLDHKSEGRVLPYAAAEARICEALRVLAWAAATRAFIAGLLEAERAS